MRGLYGRLPSAEVSLTIYPSLATSSDIFQVVRLFNVIQQSQASATAATEQVKANRGTGKPTLPAPVEESRGKKGKKKDNIIGRGKESK